MFIFRLERPYGIYSTVEIENVHDAKQRPIALYANESVVYGKGRREEIDRFRAECITSGIWTGKNAYELQMTRVRNT